GIPPAARGIPQIEVTFDIDTNGLVHVTAKDKGTGKEQSIRITAPNKLSEEEINNMVKQAEKFAEEDKKRKASVESKNKADTLVYSTEKALKDYGDKVSEEEKKAIEEKISKLKDLLKKTDATNEEIDKEVEELSKVSHKLAEEVYKAAQAEQQAQGDAQGPEAAKSENNDQKSTDEDKPKEPEVVDAEFKEENSK
ncbi:MAG: Hsp70 family protein, partial [Candidatus Omnitrophica bacterium]|nr:Hsp70 family protein [Candidatus Omnitrophota bacterium]